MRFDTRAAFIQTTTALFAIMTLCLSVPQAATFTDSSAGYSIKLPDGWKDTLLSPKSRVFSDPANAYRAIVGVVRYDYDTALFDSERDWCKAMSAAYAISVESNPFFGFIFTCDSTTHEGFFATYANAEYGMPIRAESIRWTARNHRGYELYVFSDTLDMYLHYAQYKSLLESVHIFAPTGVVAISARCPIFADHGGVVRIPVNGKLPKMIPGFQGTMVIVNCAGRRMGSVAYQDGIRTGVHSHNVIDNTPVRMMFGILPVREK